jgi:hypothetical protein
MGVTTKDNKKAKAQIGVAQEEINQCQWRSSHYFCCWWSSPEEGR